MWAEDKLVELFDKGQENWTADDWEDYNYCKGSIEATEWETAYLNGETEYLW